MRNWTNFALSAGLLTLACACGGSGDNGDPGGGTTGGNGTGTDTGTGPGTGSGGLACSVVERGLPVSGASASQPAILWTGDGYAIAWTDASGADGDIRVALLAPDGAVQAETEIAGGPEIASHPSVTRSGDRLLVVWQEEVPGGSVIRGQRVRLDGTLDGGAFTVAQSDAVEAWPIAAATGADSTAVTWMDQVGAHLGYVGQNGAMGTQVTLSGARFPGIASEGGQLGLGWSQTTDVGFARPDANGAMSPVLHEGVSAMITRVALGDEAAFVAWEDARAGAGNEQVYAVRVGADGSVSGELPVPAGSGSANWPALAWTGDRLAVAYYQFRDGPPSVFLELLNADLTRAGADLEVSGNAAARFPAVAYNPDDDQIAVAYAEKGGAVFLSIVECP